MGFTATKAVGPGYVITADSLEHLRGLKDLCAANNLPLPEFDVVKSIESMEAALKSAREGVKAGTYKWVMVDGFGSWASTVLNEQVVAAKGDGRKYWDAYTRHVLNVVERFLDLKAHVFVTMHFVETGAEMDGQVPKSGPGIAPAMQGATLRQLLPGRFPQVIWMEKKGAERVFRLSVEGVTGPGCNNLPEDVKDIPADVGVLLDALAGKEVPGSSPRKR